MRWSWWVSASLHTGLIAGASAVGLGYQASRVDAPVVLRTDVVEEPYLLVRSTRVLFRERLVQEPPREIPEIREVRPLEREEVSELPKPFRPETMEDVGIVPAEMIHPARSRERAFPIATVKSPRTSRVILPSPSGSNPPPHYPLRAQRRGLEGTVSVRLLISRKGNVLSANVETSSGSRLLDEAALNALLRWRFTPGRKGAERIAAVVVVPVRFELRKETRG